MSPSQPHKPDQPHKPVESHQPEEHLDSTRDDAAPRYGYPPERCTTTEFLCLLVTQLLCLALLAPPDGGLWLRDTLIVALGLDAVVYVAFNSGGLRQHSRLSRMATALTINAILAGFFITMAYELKRLP